MRIDAAGEPRQAVEALHTPVLHQERVHLNGESPNISISAQLQQLVLVLQALVLRTQTLVHTTILILFTTMISCCRATPVYPPALKPAHSSSLDEAIVVIIPSPAPASPGRRRRRWRSCG
jgi:hypothetical protein